MELERELVVEVEGLDLELVQRLGVVQVCWMVPALDQQLLVGVVWGLGHLQLGLDHQQVAVKRTSPLS